MDTACIKSRRMNLTQDIFYRDTEIEDHMLHNDLNPVAFIHQGGTWNYMYDKSTINLRPVIFTDNLNFEGNVHT